jgi:hypothetical protein
MRNFVFLAVIFAISNLNLRAQGLTDYYLLNFSVPDMPAFKAFGKEPSDILRPSDIQKFAVMMSPFYSNQQGVIPKNFALEFSPWKLASRSWTLDSYKGSRAFLYNSSFSIGALRDSGTYNSKVSLGYRFSLLSRDADILRGARSVVLPYLTQSIASLSALINYWVIKVAKPPIDERGGYFDRHQDEFWQWLANPGTISDPTAQAEYNALGVTSLHQIDQRADSLIEIFKKEHWNASRFDGAIAWVLESADTLLGNARSSSFHLWATYALAVHKGGQLLMGTSLARLREIEGEVPTQINVNLRYYLGTSSFRGFVEGQYRNYNVEHRNDAVLVNLGAELRISNSFWVQASAGLQNYLSETEPFNRLVSSLDVRYAFNRKE